MTVWVYRTPSTALAARVRIGAVAIAKDSSNTPDAAGQRNDDARSRTQEAVGILLGARLYPAALAHRDETLALADDE